MIKKFNNLIKRFIDIFALLLIVSSCATPTVVNIIGPRDSSMTCEELSKERSKANGYADEARKQKKMGTPHNIGAFVLFFPALGVTMKNVDEAVLAAEERTKHLNKLKEKKECS